MASIRRQSYPNVETIVVDNLSTDGTAEIAASYGAAVISRECKLLEARYLAFSRSRDDYVLLLDSDQILEPTALERAVAMMEAHDMLVLGEMSYRARSWLQRLFEADRRLIHKFADDRSLDPIRGTLLPRLFRREILAQAFGAIPEELIREAVHHDHAIIYYEAWKLSRRVGILPASVYHTETASLAELWRKNFRYGKSIRKLFVSGHYAELARGRDRGFRRGALKDLRLGIQSSLLLAFLKAARWAGYLFG